MAASAALSQFTKTFGVTKKQNWGTVHKLLHLALLKEEQEEFCILEVSKYNELAVGQLIRS